MSAEVKKEIELEIAHVLFIDIVGYSKLLITEQGELLGKLTTLVRETEAFRRADAAGKLVRIPTGDGMALVFRTTPEAPVHCAMELSTALKAHPQLTVRMGIHSGPVNEIVDVNERINITGAGINMAQRVMDCGDAGHVLLSKHVADDLEQYPQWRPLLHDLGECEVKHGVRLHLVNFYADEFGNPAVPEKFRRIASIEAAVSAVKRPASSRKYFTIAGALAAITALSLGLLLFRSKRAPTVSPASAAISEKSIAVLPFENLSEDKANAYFAEGIQDEILTRLSKIADLKVISRTSTQHYKSAPENLPDIGRQLGVAHIVEGSVQKSGDAVRVNVQLIRAVNDSHVWAESFDRKLTDLFAVESEVAKAIADQLGAHITGGEQQAISTKPTTIPEAYDAYLRGLAYNLRPGNTPTIAVAAQKYLREAVRLDPQFALAWALLAEVEANGYNTTVLPKTPELLEEARNAADTALKLQPKLGEAMYAKGYFYYGCLRDYDVASRYFEQARQLLPNSSRVLQGLAYIARRRGDWQKSAKWFEQGEQLDPRDVRVLNQYALSLLAQRRFEEALHKLDQVLNITPDDLDATLIKAATFQAQGDLTQASALVAPLQIPITNFAGLETQFRQGIFERDPASAVARLQPVLDRADPTVGWFIGDLRMSVGWAQRLAGDTIAAQQTLQQARSELEASLKQQSQNSFVISDLGLVNAMLGDKAAAFMYAQQAISTNPAEKDGVYGPGQIEVLARVAALTGETSKAITAIEQLLSTPYTMWGAPGPLTPALLRLDPMFDPLRNDPRFQKLAGEPASNENH